MVCSPKKYRKKAQMLSGQKPKLRLQEATSLRSRWAVGDVLASS